MGEINPRIWEDIFYEKIEEVITNPNSTVADLVKVTFQYGIMDRIAPLDLEMKELRQKRGSQVWPGTRKDPELYYRIIYCILASARSVINNWSSMASGYAVSIATSVMKAIYPGRYEQFFPEFNEKQSKEAIIFFYHLMIERVKQELKKLGLPAPDELFVLEGGGTYLGIQVRFNGVCFDGLMYCEVRNPMDIPKLFELSGADPNACPFKCHQGDYVPDALA